MNGAVLERPTAIASGGGLPARRAMVRWGWRLFRREWRQQLLVLALIVVAVAGTILGGAIATNLPPPAGSGFGSANHLVTLPGSDPHLGADIAAIRAHFGAIDVIENQAITTGLVQGADLRAQNPHGPYGSPMLALVSGHYPQAPQQVAVTARLASTFGVAVGGIWHDAGRSLQVVGLVENPQNLLDNFALVQPGQLTSPSQVTILFDASAASLRRFTFGHGIAAVTPHHSNGIPPAVVVFAIALVGLIFIGLVAAAGFTVLAQRRLRGLGMLSALGATDRNVRLVMLANGVAVGVVGALIGAVVGFGTWLAYVPHLATSAHHRIAWTALPWWLTIAAVVLAVLTAALAARRPARGVTRLSVVAALSGRPAPPKRVHRSFVPGLALIAVGALLLASSGGWGGGSGRDTLFQLGGLLACAIGLLLLAPAAIAILAVAARHVPVAGRIALRDLARYRARSGAALAAASFAVLIAMLITLIATGRFADPVDYFGPNLPSNDLVVYAPATDCGPGCTPAHAALPVAQLDARVGSIAASLGSHDVLSLESADVLLAQASGAVTRGGPGTIYVATPALLTHYDIAARSIDPNTMLLTSRTGLAGTARLRLLYGNLDNPKADIQSLRDPSIQTLPELPTETSAPNLLVTTAAVHRLHLHVDSSAAWIVHAGHPLTALEINAARQAAVAAGMTIETKNEAPSLAQLRNYSTIVGILVALGVLAMTVGLIRSETAGELRTLTATGASSYTRRNITAATAGALGLLGALLGTGVAYLATIAFFRSQLTQRMGNVPVLDLLLVLVALPVAAAAGGWLFAGRQPVGIAQRPIE
jgi:putative ABC transport system permease protein